MSWRDLFCMFQPYVLPISFWFLVPLANNLEAFRHVVYPTKSRWKLKCERPAASSIAFGICEQKAPACWAAKQRMKRWQKMSKIKMKTKAQMTNTNHSSLKNCLKTLYTPNIHMLLEFLNGIFFQIWTFWLQKSPSSHCTTPDFIHNGACYPDFLSPRRVPMECRQSIHRLGGCHWAEINMLPMCFFFFWRVKAPRSCNI